MASLIGTALTTLLPVLISIVGYIINKINADAALKNQFLTFVAQAQLSNVPVQLHDDYTDQLARIKAQLATQTSPVLK